MAALKNQKHELFALAIVRGLGPREAYEAAGFKPHPANPYRLRENESVSKRIGELRGRIFKRAEREIQADVDRLTKEFIRIGVANVTDVIQVRDGQTFIADTADLSEDVTAAIAEIRQTKDGVVVKMHDKIAALTNLARHIGYYKENVQLNVTLSLADLVNMSYRPDLPELPAPDVIEHEEKSD